MPLPEEYMSLESAIASLRREAPEVLKAIAKAVNALDPRAQVNRHIIDAWEYGKHIPNFAMTYGQLGAYFNLAVNKYASVLIETEVGVIQSQHVKLNRKWLLDQREQVARLPEVAKAIALRSVGSPGATVTPIVPLLENQTPESVQIELRKLNIRIERSLALLPDDQRDQEIGQLRTLLENAKAAELTAIEKAAGLAKMIKTLSLENDQLRKVRAEKNSYTVPLQQLPILVIERQQSNVEIRNLEIQKTREAVCSYARGLWAHEDLAKCRTRKMAEIVRKAFDSDLTKYLPKTDVVLARWLSEDAAPVSAKRKGRPSKSDPNK